MAGKREMEIAMSDADARKKIVVAREIGWGVSFFGQALCLVVPGALGALVHPAFYALFVAFFFCDRVGNWITVEGYRRYSGDKDGPVSVSACDL